MPGDELVLRYRNKMESEASSWKAYYTVEELKGLLLTHTTPPPQRLPSLYTTLHSWKFGRTRKGCENSSISTRGPTASLVLPGFLFQMDVRTSCTFCPLPVLGSERARENEEEKGGLRLSSEYSRAWSRVLCTK